MRRFALLIKVYLASIVCIWRIDVTHRFSRVVRYILKEMVHPLLALRWAKAVQYTPSISVWARTTPRFFLKPYRPYINRRFDFNTRVKILRCHYKMLHQCLCPSSIQSLARGTPLVVARFTGKKAGDYRIELERTDKFDREGELLLFIKSDLDGYHLFSVAFSLSDRCGYRSVELGAIQGPNDINVRDRIRVATREFHGIRPKNLMMLALSALAEAWGIPSLHCISNQARVYRHKAVYADYDSFWREQGSSNEVGGTFLLPCVPDLKTLEAIASDHRAEYRRRHELRKHIGSEIQQTLTFQYLPPTFNTSSINVSGWNGYAIEQPMSELSLAAQTGHKTHSPRSEITP